MPQFTTPASGSTSETGDTGVQSQQPPQQSLAGEIMLSKAESAALTALHFGSKDQKKAFERARAESGLSHNQIMRLKSRAEHARSQGMTLKGEKLILKPTAAPDADEPGLLRDDVTVSAKGEKGKADEAAAAKKETPNVMRRGYSGRKVADAAAPKSEKKAS